MHELALIQSLVETVEAELPVGRIHALTVKVGELAAVEPEALQFCFELCVANTRLHAANLHLVHVPAIVRCRGCDQLVERDATMPAVVWAWAQPCACGSWERDVMGGDEIRLEQVEVSDEEVC